jgi:signal transduction histidine kinase
MGVSAEQKLRRQEEEAIAEERRRIAREIHDALAQNLAALRMKAALWHDMVENNPAQMHAELDSLQEFLQISIQDIRRSLFALRPVALDESGFFPAVGRFVRDFGDQNQMAIRLDTLGNPDSLPSALEAILFRVIQELLLNIGQRFHSGQVGLELDLRPRRRLVLKVRCRGIPACPATCFPTAQQEPWGLQRMRQHIHRLKGEFHVEDHRWNPPSCEQAGMVATVFRVELPVHIEIAEEQGSP